MSSPPYITIKLEIQIPTSGGTPSVVLASPERTVGRPRFEREPILWCPGGPGSLSVPVRPGAGSGSGSCTAVGTVCGWARYGDNPPDAVRAQAILRDEVLLGKLGDTPDTTATAPGTPNADNTRWNWNGYAAQSEIPGACHSPSGVENYLIIWSHQSDGWHHKAVPFLGVTGTLDPCGSPSGTPCFSGSGSGSMVQPMAALNSKTYPALWCVVAGGFTVAPLVLFNATWALRQVTGSAHPTWDNSADGLSAPHVGLKLCPKNGWELVLRFNGTRVAYLLPFQGNAFGPLLFTPRKESLPELGLVELPKILVSAI